MQPRRLIVITGEEQASLLRAETLISRFPVDQVIDSSRDIKSVLGKEYLAVIYNCYQGFDPDLLGAIGGTIMAGGVLILVTPPLDKWSDYTDPFNERIANWPYQASDLSAYTIRRFIKKLEQTHFVTIITSDSLLSNPLELPKKISRPTDFKTVDQALAIENITHALGSDQSVPLVLEADRGRGKSAVLGMVATAFYNDNKETKQIRVTAPGRKTAAVIFRHTDERTPLSFIAPDELCHQLPDADLLLVDEAAAIPSSLLTRMLQHYPKIIFSTTVHGYEGTGRGFALRFKQQLDSLTPKWKKIILKQPVRYAENDPLEAFLFDSLLLNAKPVDCEYLQGFSLEGCSYQKVSSEALINNESLLREIFGLLVLAHYQTRPADLRHLLDGIKTSVLVIQWQGHVIATALSVEEGGFDAELAHEIHYGMRRPRGHLVPQSLAVHAGIAAAPLYTTTRIMRIVVHPALQRQGIASLLLTHLEKNAQTDYLSSSFGATKGLLEFWGKQGYQVVRIGLSRDASSGSHSVIVIKPLTQQGKAIFKMASSQFQRYFPVLLSEPLKDLEKELIKFFNDIECKAKSKAKRRSKEKPHDSDELVMTKQDQQDIDSFAYGNRGYENCMLALYKWVLKSMNDQPKWSQINELSQEILKEKIINKQSWQEIVRMMAISGKKQALKELRKAILHLNNDRKA